MLNKELLQQALDALRHSIPSRRPGEDAYCERGWSEHKAAITALREALAAPMPEPVAWGMFRADGLILDVITPEEHESHAGEYTVPLYAAPPAAPAPVVRKPLTDEQKQRIHDETGAGHALICLVESYIHGIEGGGKPAQHSENLND